MSQNAYSRRQFLHYVGAASVLASGCVRWDWKSMPPVSKRAACLRARPFQGLWQQVSYPLPLPGGDQSVPSSVQVVDDLVVPPEFRSIVIASWGDRFGPHDQAGRQIVFGYNCDHNELIERRGAPGEYWLITNHEYVSARPWLQGFAERFGEPAPDILLFKPAAENESEKGQLQVSGQRWAFASLDLTALEIRAKLGQGGMREITRLCDAMLSEVGVSVLHLREDPQTGELTVVADSPLHKRIDAVRAINVSAAVPVSFSGPVAGLGLPLAGTLANCSGAQTPWGTSLTCEENFQDWVPEFVNARGELVREQNNNFAASRSHPVLNLPIEITGVYQGATASLDGRSFGWVCEVNPETGELCKHSALGRFRHENVALRVEVGKPLTAYMGDDRRGGHVWRYVSDENVADLRDPNNQRLFHNGTLFVARFHSNFTGTWIPLKGATPLCVPEPEHCATKHMWLPRRPQGGHVSVGAPGGRPFELDAATWMHSLESFADKPFLELRLSDLVLPADSGNLSFGNSSRENLLGEQFQDAVLLMDAFAMANAIGGTPCSRPEDLEVHPVDGSVYIAFTDSTGRDEGSPDARIFPDSRGENSRQYGEIVRLIDSSFGSDGREFKWGRFMRSGEMVDGGSGFAGADNLLFDDEANLWMVCDIPPDALQAPVDRLGESKPGKKHFQGIFGNNALFFIPTSGLSAGMPRCFATAPMEAELTGPTWGPHGQSLLLSVQHPGEFHGTRGHTSEATRTIPPQELRSYLLRDGDGAYHSQERNVALGSNYPSLELGRAPKPSVVQILPRK